MALPIRRLLFLAFLPLGVAPVDARAEASSYCERVEARARIDTAVLFAPHVLTQAIRNPAMSDVGPVIGDRMQVRIGAGWAPLDVLRGVRVLDLTRADCALHTVVERGEQATAFSSEMLLVAAYAAQGAALDSSRDERAALLSQAQARLRDHLITVMAFHELQKRADALDRKYEEARGVVARARALGVQAPPKDLDALVQSYVRSSEKFERRAGKIRALEPWSLRMIGGAIPGVDGDSDWYGWVELSYNLGGLVRRSRERRYLQAKLAEVRAAARELPARVHDLTNQIAQWVAQAEREIVVVERQLKLIANTLQSLSTTTSSDVAHVRDGLVLERMYSESERAFLLALMASLSPQRDEHHEPRQ